MCRLGGTLASVVDNPTIGTDVMIVGISSQVVTLAAFGLMALDVFFKILKHRGQYNETSNALRGSKKFKLLLGALVVSYTTILLRCIYRIAEM